MNSYNSQRKISVNGLPHPPSPIPSNSMPQSNQLNLSQNPNFLPQPNQNEGNASNVGSNASHSSTSTKRLRQAADDSDNNDDSGSELASKEEMSLIPADKKSRRRKIKIEYIEDKGRRHITFSKRKAGIMKKAFELSTLTGTQVLLLVVSETGLVYTFTTPKLQPIVTKPEGKNLIQSCLNVPDAVEHTQSASLEPKSVSNASNSNVNSSNSNSGSYNNSHQSSLVSYPESNIHAADQPRIDEERKIALHNQTQNISATANPNQPNSNINTDQYFPPYYGNNQQVHHLPNRSNSGHTSNNSNLYHQAPGFQSQISSHSNMNSYVNHNSAHHNSYNLQSLSGNPNQQQTSNNSNSMGSQPLLNSSSTQNIGFSDIVANPVIPSISGFNSQQSNNHSQHQLNNPNPHSIVSSSQLYNGNYWTANIGAHSVNPNNPNPIRQTYSNNLEKL
ncbi:hypothetical protein BB561_002553 [Smittium simulii]|uniref:MADS-box domain-containing protein n=1 Tax=Smittium simulii TaxID=133385 RepID=A0A2T9YPZ2_9FUNG|nr:hypothetical protein BB561_002553 [Smittium simulii]